MATRMIEVYAEDALSARDAAQVMWEQDYGCKVLEWQGTELRQPVERYGERVIFRVYALVEKEH